MVFETIYKTLDMPNLVLLEIKGLNPFKFSQILDFQFAEISHNYLRPVNLIFS